MKYLPPAVQSGFEADREDAAKDKNNFVYLK